MPGNKGKPSGKFAETKKSAGRKGDYKRTGWPEEAPTQRVEDATGRQAGKPRQRQQLSASGAGRGRNRKAGSPI
jgi:hypothetical protein